MAGGGGCACTLATQHGGAPVMAHQSSPLPVTRLRLQAAICCSRVFARANSSPPGDPPSGERLLGHAHLNDSRALRTSSHQRAPPRPLPPDQPPPPRRPPCKPVHGSPAHVPGCAPCISIASMFNFNSHMYFPQSTSIMTRPEPVEQRTAAAAQQAGAAPADDAFVIRCSRKTHIEEWDGRLLGMECTPAQAAALEQRVLAAAQQGDFSLLHNGFCLSTLLPTKGGQLDVVEGVEAANQRAAEVWQELQQQAAGGKGEQVGQWRGQGLLRCLKVGRWRAAMGAACNFSTSCCNQTRLWLPQVFSNPSAASSPPAAAGHQWQGLLGAGARWPGALGAAAALGDGGVRAALPGLHHPVG